MTSTSSPFSVFVKNQILTVVHLNEGVRRTLCVVRIEPPYSLQVLGRHITITTSIKNYGHHLEIQSPEGTDPGQLLTQIADALAESTPPKPIRLKALLAIGIAAVVLGMGLTFVPSWFSAAPQSPVSVPAQASIQMPALNPSAEIKLQTPLPVGPSEPQRLAAPVASATTDGWPLPVSIRAGLPEKLRLAADRQLFTVQYSSGHARTLYVFADPECPNCQRLEPALNAAAGEYNVVVFPVAVIGKAKSIASVTPVLCLPFEQRKPAWDALFDRTGAVMSLGKAKPASPATDTQAAEPDNCEVARQALGVNEVAYQTYRIPGTPWVIADDGRYVAQSVLQDPALLNAFMQTQEVTDAGQ